MVEELLQDRKIVICAGSGGVGKTTTSAALALGMAQRGLKVGVVTIDPARRLANALGLDVLSNEPTHVGIDTGEGELWAMMLDPKRTFDDLIGTLAPDEKTRDEVLSNRIYQQLSSAVAGSQEFTAIAKLYDLDRTGGFDLLVLDTPPSRNALDFLDAPSRLRNFFGGRAIRVFLKPAGIGGRIFGAGTGVMFSVLKKVTGIDLLQDLSVFFRALGGLIDGFNARADHVAALLEDPGTTFLVITSPEPEPADEALYFHEQVEAAGMSFAGLIVNRVREASDGTLSPAAREALGTALADRVSVAASEVGALAARDREVIAHLRAELGDPPVICIPQFPDDVHDTEGLERVAEKLFG
jgi:anion-transporting  ArsA/GET3 family ATPase